MQSCNLKFGSWTYDGFMLNISFYGNSAEVDISDYVVSNEWELLDQPGRRNVRYYSCCGDHPYPDLTFTLAENWWFFVSDFSVMDGYSSRAVVTGWREHVTGGLCHKIDVWNARRGSAFEYLTFTLAENLWLFVSNFFVMDDYYSRAVVTGWREHVTRGLRHKIGVWNARRGTACDGLTCEYLTFTLAENVWLFVGDLYVMDVVTGWREHVIRGLRHKIDVWTAYRERYSVWWPDVHPTTPPPLRLLQLHHHAALCPAVVSYCCHLLAATRVTGQDHARFVDNLPTYFFYFSGLHQRRGEEKSFARST